MPTQQKNTQYSRMLQHIAYTHLNRWALPRPHIQSKSAAHITTDHQLIRVMENKMETTVLHRGTIGIMEKKRNLLW